ncbi:MAG: DUF924 family protein [Microcystaceae cyanobacterium]
MKPSDILDFWFTPTHSDGFGKPQDYWFKKDPQFDQKVRSHFLSVYQTAADHQLDYWQETPESCLALIILLDQFPRNMFRDQAKAFATDFKALALAKIAITQSFDQQLLPVQRWFIYLPFEHSENLADQQTAVDLFLTLKNYPDSQSTIEYADRHYQVIKTFGRFPHRNKILGRKNTPEEDIFLSQAGSSF